MTDLSHRGGLSEPIRPDGSLFERIGGREVVDWIVEGLYDRIELEPSKRHMFVGNLADERAKVEMTPLFHAAYGGHVDVVAFLLDRGAKPGPNSGPMVRHAANRGSSEFSGLLIAHGADASRVGPGPWVLSKEVADLLMENGADVNYPAGEWIWRTCTGNNSQRDNPDLVDALVDRGADLSTWLRGGTALHFAVKAGFLGPAEVLLDRGADPNAPSDDKETALF